MPPDPSPDLPGPDLPPAEALIFDLDGTLVDTVGTRIAAWLDTFAAERIPAGRGFVATLIGADGRYLAKTVAEAAGQALTDPEAEAIDRRAGERYGELNVDPRPLPGAGALLARLTAEGVPWAIATSSRAAQVAASVDALRLGQAPIVVDGSHVDHAKPAPDLLLTAAARLGAVPSACWSVGDSTWDVRAARAGGMRAVAVTTGAVGAGALADAGAHLVVATLEELDEHRVSAARDR